MSTSKTTSESITEQHVLDKGKGKAVEPVIETEDESSDEEMDIGDESHMDLEDIDDDLAEIDTSNIIQGGRRTRGAQIDFRAAEANEMVDDDEDDDDEDFKEDSAGADEDAMDTK